MVMIWNRLERDSIRRVSGLKYLSSLLKQPDFFEPGGSFWIMASEESARRNCAWLRRQGIELSLEDTYVAPLYGKTIHDPALLKRINEAASASHCRDYWRRLPRNASVCI